MRAWLGAFVLTAFNASDVDAIVALYAPDAMFLGTGSRNVTGLDTTTAVRDGKTISSPGRVTFVVARRGPEWKIAHFHRSAVPGRPN